METWRQREGVVALALLLLLLLSGHVYDIAENALSGWGPCVFHSIYVLWPGAHGTVGLRGNGLA